jgi:hypothetical protein
MIEKELEQLKYPIGQFVTPNNITSIQQADWISSIDSFPQTIASLTKKLSSDQLNWTYRPNGWSIKQLVHHCADSHINSLCRFKLALTEDNPTIRPYFENRWAELHDALEDDLSDSLVLLTGLHGKWVRLLKSLKEEQLERTFVHPDSNALITLKENIGIYAWHCAHHLAHIREALESKGKY